VTAVGLTIAQAACPHYNVLLQTVDAMRNEGVMTWCYHRIPISACTFTPA
jgi:hypothetical protein